MTKKRLSISSTQGQVWCVQPSPSPWAAPLPHQWSEEERTIAATAEMPTAAVAAIQVEGEKQEAEASVTTGQVGGVSLLVSLRRVANLSPKLPLVSLPICLHLGPP